MSIKLSEERDEEAWRAKAVVACDGNGNGCVVWYVGGSLRNEIEECGLRGLDDLGLDDAPIGISVWEGTYVWISGGYESPSDGEMVVASNSFFRAPTNDEWTAIREKQNPWEPMCPLCGGVGYECTCHQAPDVEEGSVP